MDPTRVCISGDSAGGRLAAAVTQQVHYIILFKIFLFIFFNILFIYLFTFVFELLFFYCCSSTVVPISPSSLPSSPPMPSSPPPSNPLWLCLWVLYTCSLTNLPLFSPIIPSHIPSGYCQLVLYFSVSGYIFLACFLY